MTKSIHFTYHTTRPSFFKNLRALYLSLAICFSVLACNLPGEPSASEEFIPDFTESQALYDELGLSLEEAMAVEMEDQRPGVIDQLGPPDSFTLRWHELEGQPVRWEEWSYYDFRSRFDFVDGELLWTLDLDPAPNGSFYAHAFNPLDFSYGQSSEQVMATLPDLDWQQISLEEADIEAGELLAADQILLGFDQNRLVFVQTFILTPESPYVGPELPAAAPTTTPTQSATATIETQADTSLINDEFDNPADTAIPLFGEQYMEFNAVNGVGELVSHSTGVMPAMYHDGIAADFSLSARFLLPQTVFETFYGLLFRAEDPVDGMETYYFLYLVPENATLYLDRYQDGGFHNVDQVSYSVALESPTDPIDLELAARGDRFDVWLNGIQLLSTVDPDPLLQAGNIGLAIVSNEPGAVMRVEYFQVDPLND